MMDFFGLLAIPPANTQGCELLRNTNVREAEGGNAARSTSPERNYTETGREELDCDKALVGAAVRTEDALSLAAVSSCD